MVYNINETKALYLEQLRLLAILYGEARTSDAKNNGLTGF
jgi:hypothetical protein